MSDVVRIRVRGHSMRPSLQDGDEIEVALGAPVSPGDVVLFLDGTVPTLHRVLSLRGGRVLTQGDAASRPDAPVDAARILGVARLPRRRALALRRSILESLRASVRSLLGQRAMSWVRTARG